MEEKGQRIEFTIIQRKKQQNWKNYGVGGILCPKMLVGKYVQDRKFLVNCHEILLEFFLSHS